MRPMAAATAGERSTGSTMPQPNSSAARSAADRKWRSPPTTGCHAQAGFAETSAAAGEAAATSEKRLKPIAQPRGRFARTSTGSPGAAQ